MASTLANGAVKTDNGVRESMAVGEADDVLLSSLCHAPYPCHVHQVPVTLRPEADGPGCRRAPIVRDHHKLFETWIAI